MSFAGDIYGMAAILNYTQVLIVAAYSKDYVINFKRPGTMCKNVRKVYGLVLDTLNKF